MTRRTKGAFSKGVQLPRVTVTDTGTSSLSAEAILQRLLTEQIEQHTAPLRKQVRELENELRRERRTVETIRSLVMDSNVISELSPVKPVRAQREPIPEEEQGPAAELADDDQFGTGRWI